MNTQLKALHITVTRQNKHPILNSIDIHINAGEVVALLGANGAGKSTLSSILAGDELSLPILSGEVWLNELNVHQTPSKILAQHRAVLTQHTQLNFNLCVRDIIEMGTYPFAIVEGVEELIQQALIWADIKHLEYRLYQQLSGGEQQRVQFSRILVQLFCQYNNPQSPRYCLLDEPTSSLDPKYQQSLLKTLKRLANELNIGVFVVLHDVNLAAFYCDKLILLSQGNIIAQGEPQQVLTPDNLEATYGLRGQCIPHPLTTNKVLVIWEDTIP